MQSPLAIKTLVSTISLHKLLVSFKSNISLRYGSLLSSHQQCLPVIANTLSTFSRNDSIFERKMNEVDSEKFRCRKEKATGAPKLTFVSHANPVTGKMDWRVENEDYDYIQEIARSGYGDMLNDTDRNEKYDAAIKQAVQYLRQQGKPVKAFDIGTGTGLLSMMAVRAGVDSSVACEAFLPMAECAEKILRANNCAEKVKLVHKRSTDVTLDDLGEKANLLITELFDTELIGEGAIGSYSDAHNRLMEDDCVAVPTSGRMYVQAVHSDLLRQWTSLQPIHVPGRDGSQRITLSPPPHFEICGGAPSLHDLQVDQLAGKLTLISEPVEVFKFDFSKKSALKKKEHSIRQVTALCDGRVDAFVMWWDLVMDPQGTIFLSCAPSWMRDKSLPVPWRDHWMQALYYPDEPLKVSRGDPFSIHSYHDEYSLWFDTSDKHSERPVCACGLHVALSRSKIGQMNQTRRNEMFIDILRQHVSRQTICLVISDGSLSPLIVAALGAKKVFYLDTNVSSRKLIKQMVQHNGLQERVVILEKNTDALEASDFENLKIDVVFAEPFFLACQLPWEHLYFWYALETLNSHLTPSATVLPRAMIIRAMAVQFRDLHKIRAPVGNCEGFDITEFDNLIHTSSEAADALIEPQPLWEYPCTALSPPVTLTSLDFTQTVHKAKSDTTSSQIICHRVGKLNAIVLWTEYSVTEDQRVSMGLLEGDLKDQKEVKWDMFSRQGVKFFPNAVDVQPGTSIDITARFDPETGDFSFTFK